MAAPRILTIGHSNQSLEAFLGLLRRHRIEAVVDVRSRPYSKYTQHFSGDALHAALGEAGIKYVFLGGELGGRPDEDEYYDDQDHVLYWRLAESPRFLEGIGRLEAGIARFRVAIMCSEDDPIGCHRRLLVGRVLAGRGIAVEHIRGSGAVETEEQVAGREAAERPQLALFDEPEEVTWRSIRSVSRSARPGTSSEP
jgi:uncharacterized protein (DUF488 family)